MSTLTMSRPTVLSPGCGCDGYFKSVMQGLGAECNICGEGVNVALDIEPHLEDGERLVWVPDTDGEGHDRGLVLAYFTEEIV